MLNYHIIEQYHKPAKEDEDIQEKLPEPEISKVDIKTI